MAPRAVSLQSAWDANLVPLVGDAQLGTALVQMHRYLDATGFFADRLDGMRLVVDRDTGFEVQLAPNRKNVPDGRASINAEACVMCEQTDPLERRTRWRGYWIRPNAFPYAPAESHHTLIIPTDHQPQSFSRPLLTDMLDYQRLTGTRRPVTLHYNGIAGNSQYHLHWQATHETLPLQRALDGGDLAQSNLRNDANGRVATFERDYCSGFVVEGDRDYVVRWVSELVDRLDRDEKTSVVDEQHGRRGVYNLLALHPKNGRQRVVVIARRPELEHRRNAGAFSLGGRVVLMKDAVPDGFVQKVIQAGTHAVVRPSQLRWTSQIASMPASALLRLRAA